MILATCYNNKLTNSICDGDREVDWNKAKTIKERRFLSCQYDEADWKGTGRRRIGQKKIYIYHCVLRINYVLA